MKKLLTLLSGIFVLHLVQAQQPVAQNPYPKTISVTGSAELEIAPDQIFVQITLQEYQKKGDSKKDLANIKSDFIATCRSVGIADSLISIAGYSGDNDYFAMKRNKRKPDELFASVVYQ